MSESILLSAKWFSSLYDPVFSRQTHVVTPAYTSISDLEVVLKTQISAILLTHEFTDHSHQETLKTANSATPVFGHPRAKARVDGWQIFNKPVAPFRVYRNQDLNPLPDSLTSLAELAEWRDTEGTGLPPNVSVLYVPTDSWIDPAGDRLHALTIITFTVGNEDQQTYSILYSPHGVPISALERTLSAFDALPHHVCLALLHTWDHVSLPLLGHINLGKDSGKMIARRFKPKYWLRTRKLSFE